MPPWRRSCCGWKVPLPLPSSTLTLLLCVIGDDQVGLAVAVDVRHRHGERAPCRRRRSAAAGRCRCRCPAARSRLLPPSSATTRSGLPSPLTSATATERGSSRWRRSAGLEGAVAVAQQHAHVAADVVGDDEVGLAVAVDVRHRHGRGFEPAAKVSGAWKVPSPLPSSTLTVSCS